MALSETSSTATPPPAPREPSPPLVILNPAAGMGRADRRFRRVERSFETWPTPPRVVRTSAPGHATRLAAEAPPATDLVVAVGGDGTANEVANGLLQRPGGQGRSVLGYVPLGTGCDFARALGLSREPEDTASAMADGRDVEVDVGRIEMTTPSGITVRYFLNAANVGAAPAVIRRLGQVRWLARLGAAAYVASVVREAFSVRPVAVRLTPDSEAGVVERAINVSVCNGPAFGGGMRLCPPAGLDTGMLDVVLVGDIGLVAILALVPHLRGDGVVGRQGILHRSCRTVRLEVPDSDAAGGGPTPVEVDGEVPGQLPATFSIIPGGLKVRVPSRAGSPLGRRDPGW